MTEKKSAMSRLKGLKDAAIAKVASTFGFDLTARYDSPNGAVVLPVDMEGDTVWATQAQIADLFQTDVSGVSRHLRKVFDDGELDEESNLQKMQIASSTKPVAVYSLEAILAVGYRVNSRKAGEFRQWASKVLSGYIKDGYALNGQRLDADPQALLRLAQEVRAIRTEEKNLYAQVREVFKIASIDYDATSETARKFFAEAQDTMLYAATERTASEIIVTRCDAEKPNMGLVALGNQRPTKKDTTVAKNFLPPEELRRMRLIGEAFLLYVEGLAEREKQVSMARLLTKFREVVKFYDYPVFPGYTYPRPTAAEAKQHANRQYELFNRRGGSALPPV